jgi:hypothetical protein
VTRVCVSVQAGNFRKHAGACRQGTTKKPAEVAPSAATLQRRVQLVGIRRYADTYRTVGPTWPEVLGESGSVVRVWACDSRHSAWWPRCKTHCHCHCNVHINCNLAVVCQAAVHVNGTDHDAGRLGIKARKIEILIDA